MAKKKKKEKRTPAVIRHNPSVTILAVIIVLFTGYVYGMRSKVPSIKYEGKKVTRAQLKVEVKSEIARHEREVEELMDNAEVGFEELDRQDAFKARLLEAGAVVVNSILDPTASAKGIAGLTITGLMGAFLADDIRRNKKLNDLKNNKK